MRKEVLTCYTLGAELIKLLGMPNHVISFDLHCAAGEMVTVKCEYYPEGDPYLVGAVLAEYEMRTLKHPAETLGFDVWMAQRIETAHQVMLRDLRPSYNPGNPRSRT